MNGCRAWVWTPRDGGLCLLKSQASDAYPTSGVIAAVLAEEPPQLTGSCPVQEANTDYPGNDLVRTQRATIYLCCNDCEATDGCARFVYYGGDCILKSAGGTAIPYPGAIASSFIARGPSTEPKPVIEVQTYGSYPSPTTSFASIARATWLPLTESLKAGINLFANMTLPTNAEMQAKQTSPPPPRLEATIDTYYFPLVQSVGECAVFTSTSGYVFFTYVSSTLVCIVHDFTSTSTTTYALNPPEQPLVLGQSLPWDFQISQDAASASLAACQTSCAEVAWCAAVTFEAGLCTYFGPVSSDASAIAGWVHDPITWNEVAGTMQYVTMKQRDISLEGYVTFIATSADTIASCASAAAANDLHVFSFDDSELVCTLVEIPEKESTTLQLFNYPASPVVLAGNNVPTGALAVVVAATTSAGCQLKCIPSATGCFGSTFDTATNTCTLLIATFAASTTLGWVVPNTLAKTVANPSAVAIFVNAHQDDHELFMSAQLYDAFSSVDTKIVMIYTSAGDAGATNGWWQARELGTLASAQTFVKHFGLFTPVRYTSTVVVNGHVITKVTMGNAIHYFLRLPEAGMAMLPTQTTAPIDKPSEIYTDLAALTDVVISLIKSEASGISNTVVNTHQFIDTDHVLHAMTGRLVSNGIAEDAILRQCATQNYFWGYQHWLDDVNMINPPLNEQRHIWWALNLAVVQQYPDSSPWYDHCQVLGRQYLASSIEASGTC
ncbi:hypothetical protein ACHHYP_07249 [Achlya hypogyna]|nr:hypothetical protein ACHHYP_07249 [Achlya hypogyna]